MMPGTTLLWVSFWCSIGALILSILELFRTQRSYSKFSMIFSMVSVWVLGIAFFLMVIYFATSNLSIEYVHSYTKIDYTLGYKISGVWAGQKGSLLIWAFFIGLALICEELLMYRRGRDMVRGHDKDGQGPKTKGQWPIFRSITLAIFTVFIWILISIDVFATTRPEGLEQAPDGFGLSKVLLTPLMMIHPPTEFAAYAFTAIPLASGFTFLITGNVEWLALSIKWGRLSWLLMTLGLGLGGLWAYIVLGWGGYWAWDPVETSNLLTWIALTGLVHAQIYSKKKRGFKNTAIIFAMLSFILTLLASFITRSGLWISVHDFTTTEAGSLVDRLSAVLVDGPASRNFTIMMMATMIVGGILFIWRHVRNGPNTRSNFIFPLAYILFLSFLLSWVIISVDSFVIYGIQLAHIIGRGNDLRGIVLLLIALIGTPMIWMFMTSKIDLGPLNFKGSISSNGLMTMALFLLLLGVLATTYLLFAGIAGIKPQDYQSNGAYVIAPLAAVLVGCLMWRVLGRKVIAYLILGTVSSMIIISVLSIFRKQMDIPIETGLYSITFVLIVLALFVSFQKTLLTARSKKVTNSYIRLAGVLMLVSSVLGVSMWGSGPSDVHIGIIIIGFFLSLIALLGAITVMNGRSFGLGLMGAICAVLSIGYYIGAILGIIAAVLLIIGNRNALGTRSRRTKLRYPCMIPRVRASSSHLIHLGVVMVLLAYILGQGLVPWLPAQPEENRAFLLTKGSTANFAGYTFVLKGSNGQKLEQDPAIDILEVVIEVSNNGKVVGKAHVRMVLDRFKGYYEPEVYILKEAINDLYFIPLAFWSNNAHDYIHIQDEPGLVFFDDAIDSVVLKIDIIPGVSIVWGGLWLSTVGIAIRFGTDHLPLGRLRGRWVRARPPNGPRRPKALGDGMVECPVCSSRLKPRNLPKHLEKVHGRSRDH